MAFHQKGRHKKYVKNKDKITPKKTPKTEAGNKVAVHVLEHEQNTNLQKH